MNRDARRSLGLRRRPEKVDTDIVPEDRAEQGAVDAGVANESKQVCILLE